MKVVGPIGEAVQVDIEILKEAALVIPPLDGHAEPAAHPGIDSVGCDKIATTDHFFFVSAVCMRDAGGDSIGFQSQIVKGRVVFDGPAES